MGRQIAKLPTAGPRRDSDLCDRARGGYYAAMTEVEKLENNLQRRITRREWSAFRYRRALELYA